MKLLKTIFFLFLIITSQQSISQTTSNTVKGKVNDENGQALEFANILLLKSVDSSFVKGAISDKLGNYSIQDINSGDYIVSASVVGYNQIYSKPFSIKSSGTNIQVETLQFSAGTQLDEVNIVTTKPLFEKAADRTIINVENSVINAGSDAWEILQRAPGLTVDNNDEISILGKSGTIVLIDGKRTFLSGDALATLLRSTPSTNISKIEVITNPSAKYDASGNAGVINIINKKSIVTGFNANLSLNAGAGWNEFINPGLNFNYRAEKFNVYGNYSYADRERSLELGLLRRILNDTQNVIFDQEQETVTNTDEHLYSLGFDYYIAPKHTLGFNFRGFNRIGNDNGLSHSDIEDTFNPDQDLDVETNSDAFLENYAFTFNYDGKLSDKSNIYIELNSITYTISDDSFYDVLLDEENNNTPLRDDLLRNLEDSDIDIKSYQFDLSHSISKTFSLDWGAKYSDVFTSNTLQFDEFNNGTWENDPDISSQFNYDENVLAGYINFSKTYEKYKFTGGLRVENTESIGNTISSKTERNYTDYFPSFSVNYSLNDTKNLGLSYSRRIDRPSYQNLNPFIFFIDPFTFAEGNPLLQPQYTNNFETSYNSKNWTFSLGYSHTKDAIRFITIQNDAELTGIATNINLDHLYNYNGTINYQKQLANWWRMFTSASIFYNHYKSDFEGSKINQGVASFRVNTSNTFNLKNSLKFEFNGFFQSPSATALGRNDTFYIFNLGVQKTLFKKLNTRLTFNDIFDSSGATGSVEFENQDLEFFFRRKNSRFVLALTYPIGNDKIKAAKKKKSGALDEDSRVIKQ
ncbi:TonB-dependent receptor [uncultured Psychroserpens sp.]|uniref:TonB-dependent receptor domain-containing protein n=1 Tax=uncultured Psychroserpens sp. TaxID=255436 RepID=UPI00260C762F|nr:TonB-dependent receptor [uncultured Psychroserpens sp.]